MKTILLISPYWKEDHRWMVSSVKLAELWVRLGYKVEVVCMGKENGKWKMENGKLVVHTRKDIFIPDPWNYGICFGFTGYVRKLIHEVQPDHIVCNKILFWTSLSVIALRLTGHKVILLTDAFVGMTWWPRSFIPKVAAAIYAWTAGWLIMLCAEKVVTFFPQPPSLLKRLFIFKKTQVIPTGIDAFPYENAERQKGRNAEVTVTYVGRLESVKGVDDFVAAACVIKKDNPNVKMQVVGWYKDGHPLVKQYQRDVVFMGLRDDVSDILAHTDIFVLPSHSEGLSNALMEAMSSSCACIASDVGGNRFLIQNGVSGFLFPAGDREALTSQIRKLIEDPAKRMAMGQAARKRIEEEFDWKVVGEKYKNLFDSI